MTNADARSAPYLLGIDYGTESSRVAIFDAAGMPVSFASTGYPTCYPLRLGRVRSWMTGTRP